MIFSRYPFQGETLEELKQNILEKEPDCNYMELGMVSFTNITDLMSLIKGLLSKDRSKRPSLLEIQKNPWLLNQEKESQWMSDLEYSTELSPGSKEVTSAVTQMEKKKNVMILKK
mmetsp:Transcript_10506/g.16081  ORF Transcript_10506/g.16081 Transcript_10506/m.16081 type:complete len:115 (-) Transcript_10506:8-352(-)